ncbi:MAG: DUF1016 domain-containing protein, partial [bacterium]|nr:DUF1016 domain-containing protein [bacterium]
MPKKAVAKKTPASLFKEISSLINEAKNNVKIAVNSELVLLYWNIGKAIKKEILDNKRADYGEKILEELSIYLTQNYGKGFSRPNLSRMIKFYDLYPDERICSSVMNKFTWTHITHFISIDDPLKREFYMTMCSHEGWSVRTLSGRIDSMLFERTALSKKPEKTIIGDLQKLKEKGEMTPDLFYKDPYILDFLDLKEAHSESDFETAILIELQNFILEMGSDFAFLARQKRII